MEISSNDFQRTRVIFSGGGVLYPSPWSASLIMILLQKYGIFGTSWHKFVDGDNKKGINLKWSGVEIWNEKRLETWNLGWDAVQMEDVSKKKK